MSFHPGAYYWLGVSPKRSIENCLLWGVGGILIRQFSYQSPMIHHQRSLPWTNPRDAQRRRHQRKKKPPVKLPKRPSETGHWQTGGRIVYRWYIDLTIEFRVDQVRHQKKISNFPFNPGWLIGFYGSCRRNAVKLWRIPGFLLTKKTPSLFQGCWLLVTQGKGNSSPPKRNKASWVLCLKNSQTKMSEMSCVKKTWTDNWQRIVDDKNHGAVNPSHPCPVYLPIHLP